MREKLKILLASSFFINLGAGLFGPIYAVFVENIGGNLLTAGSAYAAFSIVSGVLIYILGKWEDKIKHQENLLIIARVLTVFGVAGYLLIKIPIHLFIVQIILGVSDALGTPAYDSLYSKNLQKGKFASQWGAWEAMYYITVGIAAVIGGYLANEYGFRVVFITMLVISIISLISTILLKGKIKDGVQKISRSL